LLDLGNYELNEIKGIPDLDTHRVGQKAFMLSL